MCEVKKQVCFLIRTDRFIASELQMDTYLQFKCWGEKGDLKSIQARYAELFRPHDTLEGDEKWEACGDVHLLNMAICGAGNTADRLALERKNNAIISSQRKEEMQTEFNQAE